MFKKCLLAMSLCLVLAAAPKVKVIDLSWSNPTVAFLEKHLAEMEKDSPLDGLTIRFSGKPEEIDGKKHAPSSGNAWNRKPWKFEQLQDEIQRYKALHFTQFTDNFFYLTTSQMDFDWCNDNDWKSVASNFGVAAKAAKEMGLKGLLVDIEEYGKNFWDYGDDVHPKEISYDELSKVVFKRGQQWGDAIFGAYPNIILFMPYALSMRNATLVYPFLNGVIDVMPPTALIYDGCESQGYRAKSPLEYGRIQNSLRKTIRMEIMEKNRVKARAQVLLSPAFYLDAHWTASRTSIYYQALLPEMEEQGHVKFFARNFLGAMEEAEPYIWLYGEKRCWWKGSPHSKVLGTWDEAPNAEGLSKTIIALKDLDNFRLEPGKNLAIDPTFTGKEHAWTLWQLEDDKKLPAPGNGVIGNGKAVARKVKHGCFHQTIPITPGKFYFYLVKGGYQGSSGRAGASLCFQDASHKWLSHNVNLHLKLPQSDKLETCYGYVLAPENAAFVSIQCGVSGQGDEGEIYFTEVSLSEF
ncbi:MAG: hypothetical protein IKP00_14350 [Victivallales bacterium]|nr:hypothetical protein [Victivallales bacterium]